MMQAAVSKNGVSIRLTDERWTHIVEEHCELAGLRDEVLETVSEPQSVLAGGADELLAVRRLDPRTALVVVYERGDAGGRFRHHGIPDDPARQARTEAAAMAPAEIKSYLDLIPAVLRSPRQLLWSSYDAEADVLYVNFKKPARATDSEITDDDVIVRYEGDEVIGLTILHASRR